MTTKLNTPLKREIEIDEFFLGDEHLFKHALVRKILSFNILALSF